MRNKNQTLEQIMLSRRSFLQAGGVGIVLAALPLKLNAKNNCENYAGYFNEVMRTKTSQTVRIPLNYSAKPLLKWGDDLQQKGVFDASAITPDSQAQAFGYNNDFIAYMPINGSSLHGLLCVNHEYCSSDLMFSPNILQGLQGAALEAELERRAQIEMMAHGCSVAEIRRIRGEWQFVRGSAYNHRITAHTKMRITGAAAGDSLMQTSADKTGSVAYGTLGNCSGGTTPWGTVLTAEENFDVYFYGDAKTISKPEYQAYTIGKKSLYNWHKIDSRFNLDIEPNEPNRFGWIVEYNPYDKTVTPRKLTSLGRFKHECARLHVNYDGRIVIYSGDDEMFEYLYRYVSHHKYVAGDDAHNARLLDEGDLYVARFEADGSLRWLPLRYGEGGLTPQNGFNSQAEVLINARRAGDVVGATPMDRPEDIEIHPVSSAVYVSLTMNIERGQTNAANPRKNNAMGHILQLNPKQTNAGFDHASEYFTWQPFLLGGDPANREQGAYYQNQPSENGWLANPDNLAIDNAGNLWVATDGQQKSLGFNETLYMVATHGEKLGAPRAFLTAPIGAEVTGHCFTPDNRTMFVSIQHPAEGSNFDAPSTRFPDFNAANPPRPCVLAINHIDNKIIGMS
jgi:secreted PhoX family phosphatase